MSLFSNEIDTLLNRAEEELSEGADSAAIRYVIYAVDTLRDWMESRGYDDE